MISKLIIISIVLFLTVLPPKFCCAQPFEGFITRAEVAEYKDADFLKMKQKLVKSYFNWNDSTCIFLDKIYKIVYLFKDYDQIRTWYLDIVPSQLYGSVKSEKIKILSKERTEASNQRS